MYILSAGIKHGLPLSPMIFLFYINDTIAILDSIYSKATNTSYNLLHILLHVDNATLLASTRNLCNLLHCCSTNRIISQYTKCEFIFINGSASDRKPIPFGDVTNSHAEHLTLLGSNLSCSGRLTDLNLDYCSHLHSCIKCYNFILSNKLAPLSVKIKVLNLVIEFQMIYISALQID